MAHINARLLNLAIIHAFLWLFLSWKEDHLSLYAFLHFLNYLTCRCHTSCVHFASDPFWLWSLLSPLMGEVWRRLLISCQYWNLALFRLWLWASSADPLIPKFAHKYAFDICRSTAADFLSSSSVTAFLSFSSSFCTFSLFSLLYTCQLTNCSIYLGGWWEYLFLGRILDILDCWYPGQWWTASTWEVSSLVTSTRRAS